MNSMDGGKYEHWEHQYLKTHPESKQFLWGTKSQSKTQQTKTKKAKKTCKQHLR